MMNPQPWASTSSRKVHLRLDVDSGKVSDFSLTLMRMDTEQLGIPDDSFTSECTMPASEFSRICKEFGGIGDSSNNSVST